MNGLQKDVSLQDSVIAAQMYNKVNMCNYF